MFWDNFVSLCTQKGTTPTAVVKRLGIAAGSVTSWKKGSIPQATTLQKITDYFGVSAGYLLGSDESQSGRPASNEYGAAPSFRNPSAYTPSPEFVVHWKKEIMNIVDTLNTAELNELHNYLNYLLSKRQSAPETVRVYRAARSASNHDAEIVEMDAARLEKLRNAPETDDDLM